jgi:hypothetical protein
MKPYGSKDNKKHPCACCLPREKYAKMALKKRERQKTKRELKNEISGPKTKGRLSVSILRREK